MSEDYYNNLKGKFKDKLLFGIIVAVIMLIIKLISDYWK